MSNSRPAPASPIFEKERLNSLDVLRGFAVLAIFIVNVKMMANGFNHYVDVALWEGEAAQFIGLLHSRLVHGKFVTIFTALFGAGLALLLARENPVPLRIVLQRLFWLAVFGGLHLIFLREGDILVWYAMAGLIAVPFARLSAPRLLVLGFALQVVAFFYYQYAPFSEGDIPTLWRTSAEAHNDVAVIMLGTVGEQISARIDTVGYYLVNLFVLQGVWIDTLSVMLLGMALLKTGFFTGKLPLKWYTILGMAGLLLASARFLLAPYLDADNSLQSAVMSAVRQLHYLSGSLAWSSLIIGAVAAGWQAKRFAAVGRTAFTVYILQSAVGLLLFSSLGFGLFGQLSLPALTAITVLVWIAFLYVAPLWLRYFQYGPLEWIWRSLTYGARQPFSRLPG